MRAGLRLQDLDLEGLSSEDLSVVPPNLALFLDNAASNFDSDRADLVLTFALPNLGVNSINFRLDSLTVAQVPEPGTGLLMLLGGSVGAITLVRKRRTV